MKKILILVNPYPNVEAETFQPRRLKEELKRLGASCEIVSNRYCAMVRNGEIDLLLKEYDACVYFDKDKYTHRMLERKGMRLFNRADAVEVCDDKMTTCIALSGKGIAMPKTLPAPLCYNSNADMQSETQEIIDILGLPVVVKECYGSLGKQVYLAETAQELFDLVNNLKLKPHIYQQFIAESRGRDLRVICVGGEVVATMKRTHEQDFRSNMALGGRGERVEATEEVRTLCRKISDILQLDYCGIDLLLAKSGYLLCEVNSNAFFGGIEQVTGANVAARYAEYILNNI